VLLAAILASPKYHAWYLGMVLPLAVLLPTGGRLRAAVLALGVANLLSFTFVTQAHLLNVALMLGLPLWLVTGTDEAGVTAAAGAFDEGTLQRRFALAVDGDGLGVALPDQAR